MVTLSSDDKVEYDGDVEMEPGSDDARDEHVMVVRR